MTNYLDNPKNFLIKEFVRVVKDKMPEVFILENVPQFISCGNGQFLKEVELQLEQYEIEYKILNAVSFGVPQDRKRAIVIGSRIGRIYHPETCVTEFKTVREAFQGLNNDVPNQKDYSRARKDTLERIKCVPQGGNFKNIPETLRTKGQHSDFYKRLKWDEPSITIANPRKAVIIHPEEDRILSIRECARIQSFPDDYIFYGTLADKQQQVADAVPPLLSEAIAKQIKKYIEIGIGYKNSITA
jgi:DNA (cytosine-5)-methyltransferase 1